MRGPTADLLERDGSERRTHFRKRDCPARGRAAAWRRSIDLRTPGYYNKTIGPKFIAKVEDVKKLLSDADGYYNSGRYDLAFKKYDQVLALDPYNQAARRGQERLDNAKYHYGEEAYNESRAR